MWFCFKTRRRRRREKRWKKGEAKYTLSYLGGGGFAATTCLPRRPTDRPRRHSFSRISRPVERSGIIYLLSPSSSPSLSHTHTAHGIYSFLKVVWVHISKFSLFFCLFIEGPLTVITILELEPLDLNGLCSIQSPDVPQCGEPQSRLDTSSRLGATLCREL